MTTPTAAPATATAAVLGRVGLPEPPSRARGAPLGRHHRRRRTQRPGVRGLPRPGRRKVLVLEARERVGGACTLEEPWPGVRFSPCAYVAGLLHHLVIDELALPQRGLEWFPAAGGMFVPFEDGTSIQLWDDDAKCEAEIQRFAPGDLAGWRAMSDVKRRLRDALRPGARSTLDRAGRRRATRSSAGSARRRGAQTALRVVDGRVRGALSRRRAPAIAYLGQGVIGTNASPHDPGRPASTSTTPPVACSASPACGATCAAEWA